MVATTIEPTAQPDRGMSIGRAFGATALVLGASAIAGALTPFGEIHLPHSINAAADSSGPWAMVAFATIYLARARGVFAALLGACSFVVMDLLFFIAFELRIGHYPHLYLVFWVGVAVIVGPLVGLCASWLRSSHVVLREIAVAAPSSILIGEGAYMLAKLPGESSLYAVASIFVGLVLLTGLAAFTLRSLGPVLISFLMCAVATALFYKVYGLLPLVVHRVVP